MFNYKVLKPWERDPAFYKTIWTSRSDVPAHEGPSHHKLTELWQYKFPLNSKEKLKKEAGKYIEIFKDHPYIFNLGHGILPETDPNMMDYLVKTVKDY